MKLSNVKILSGIFCGFLSLSLVISNFAQSPSIQNRMPTAEGDAPREGEPLAEEMSESELKAALEEALRRQQAENQIRIPLRDAEGKLTGEFGVTTWDAATASQVQDAFKQNVGMRHTVVSQAVTFPSTHVGFALAIHVVTALECSGNLFGVPVHTPHKASSPSCGEDTLVGLLTDPLGIAGFYSFMLMNAQVSGRLNNLHIKQIERLGLKRGLSLDERKANVRRYMMKNGLSAKMMYGYVGMAAGSLTQDLLMDLVTQSKPCLSRFKLGLGLGSTECLAFKDYMTGSEKWLEFMGSTGNMLSAAFAAFLVQTGVNKVFGPILGKTISLIGSKVFLVGFTFTPGGGLKAVFSFGKAAAHTFSHAIYFVYFEEVLRDKIMKPWYNIVHNKFYAGRELDSALEDVEEMQKNFWAPLDDADKEQEFKGVLRSLDSRLKESQLKSHLRALDEEKTPMFHRKASGLYAAYEGTKKLYSYVNDARSENYTRPLEIKPEDLDWLNGKVDEFKASVDEREKLNEEYGRTAGGNIYFRDQEEIRKTRIWLDKIEALFSEDRKAFNLKEYFSLRREFLNLYLEGQITYTYRTIADTLMDYWYEIDSFVEANVTSEDVLSKFYNGEDDGLSFYEVLNEMSYADSEGERFFGPKSKSNTVFDWVALKSICGDQAFGIEDEHTYSIKFTPAGVIDRTKVKLNCKDPRHVYPLLQNKYKSDYLVNMDRINQLRTDFEAKIPQDHNDYTKLLEMVDDIYERAEALNDSAQASANSVSWFQVIAYTSKLKRLHRFINRSNPDPESMQTHGMSVYYTSYLPSITKSTSFTFEVRDLITESEANRIEHHATSRHALYSVYSPEDELLVEDEYSGIHLLLNPKVPLKPFIKSNLNIWWLENVQKETLKSHLNLVVEYKEMIEEEVLSKNAVHLHDYIEGGDFESAVTKASEELLSKTSELRFIEPVKNGRGQQTNYREIRAHFKRYRDELTSESYDLQTLAKTRFYLDMFKSLMKNRLYSSVRKTNEEIELEATLNTQMDSILKGLAKVLVQLSYKSGEIEESKTYVEGMIVRLNTAVIENHKQFAYPNTHDEFVYYTDEDFTAANEDLKARINNIFEFEPGKAGAFVLADANGGGAQMEYYRESIQRSIRDHYSLYLQNTLLIDDEKKVLFRTSLVDVFDQIEALEETIKGSSVKNIDIFTELSGFLRAGVNDVNDFYNRYIEASELLPHAGLAAISTL